MSDLFEQLQIVQQELPAIRQRLSPAEAEAFAQKVAAIAVAARDHPERAAELQSQLSELSAVVSKLAVPGAASAPARAPAARQTPAAAATPPQPSVKHRMNTRAPASQTESPATEPFWTPELILQAFKEVVTGILGIAVIGYTLFIAYDTRAFVGDQAKMAHKDILTIMLGLAGVVLGYYFGRMPADARAAEATHNAAGVLARAERVKVKARELADQMAETVESSSTRGGPSPDDLARLSARARDIASMTLR